jgi:hypothetical protein
MKKSTEMLSTKYCKNKTVTNRTTNNTSQTIVAQEALKYMSSINKISYIRCNMPDKQTISHCHLPDIFKSCQLWVNVCRRKKLPLQKLTLQQTV